MGMAFQDKKFLDAAGITHLVGLLDEYPNNQVLGTVIDAIEGELEQKAEKSEIPDVPVQDVKINGTSVLDMDGNAEIPVGSNTTLGVVKGNSIYGVTVWGGTTAGQLAIVPATDGQIKASNQPYTPITPTTQSQSVFYGLAKAAGHDEKNSTLPVGQYTPEAQSAIRSMIGAANPDDIVAVQDTQPTSEDNKIWLPETAPEGVEIPTVAEMNAALAEKVDDVQINGQSIVQNGVANVPIAGSTTLGIAKFNTNYGFSIFSNGDAYVACSNSENIKSGQGSFRPIVPTYQHEATFYGLTKAAGVDMASSSNTVGTYTPEAKGAIQTMLGTNTMIAPDENDLVADRDYAIGDLFTANGKVYKVTAEILTGAAIVTTGNNTNCEETSVTNAFVKKTEYAGSGGKNTAGLVWDYNGAWGIKIQTASGYEGALTINAAPTNVVKDGVNGSYPITAVHQHESAFYGLAKAAGADEKDSTLPVGQYTDTAKAAIKSMIGVNVEDVQANGVSVVSNGIANIPIADANVYGVLRTGNYATGLQKDPSGYIKTYCAALSTIKLATDYYQPIVPVHQHESTFYGLAKAAGDTTQSESSNAVGVYTDNAKASIKSMLGIQDGSTGTVDVSGTAPVIAAVENTRYVCGEVATLTITPPSSGICIVRFTSGSTPTVLTANNVIWPDWFDSTELEASRVYEICITDGYGAVMSWAL